MLCVTEQFKNIWPRWPKQNFIMPLNIGHPHCLNSCTIFCQTSSHLQKLHSMSMFMMLHAGHFIADNPATILSPIYPNLWMCLVRNSGLFIFLTQILIWSYSVAVLSQLYLARIQDKELHAHTFLSNILSIFHSSSILQPIGTFFAGSCPTNYMLDPFWQ
jgi:hypothetical protein